MLLLALGGVLVMVPMQAKEDVLRLAKPGGTWTAYLTDVAACNPYHPGFYGGQNLADEAKLIARSSRYFNCLSARGYRPDPKGFIAGQYVALGHTDILMLKLPD
jgi:hypothetical protein